MENVFQYSKMVPNPKAICVYKLNNPWDIVVYGTQRHSLYCFSNLILSLFFELFQDTGSIVLHGNPIHCRGLPSKVK
jgi:hypothetical protein